MDLILMGQLKCSGTERKIGFIRGGGCGGMWRRCEDRW